MEDDKKGKCHEKDFLMSQFSWRGRERRGRRKRGEVNY
jgi:hypothetical protein